MFGLDLNHRQPRRKKTKTKRYLVGGRGHYNYINIR